MKFLPLCSALFAAGTMFSNTVLSANLATALAQYEQTVQQDKQQLKDRLAALAQFSANFKQTVSDEGGNTLQQSAGKIAVKKPNLVYWQTQQPEESLIVSDGSSLWLYDPFIEQATVYSLESSIANTPILLLTSNDDSLWQQYKVEKLAEHEFVLHSLDENSQVKSLTIAFADDGKTIARFTIVDMTGQISDIVLSDLDSANELATSLFTFNVPDGVYIDDQR